MMADGLDNRGNRGFEWRLPHGYLQKVEKGLETNATLSDNALVGLPAVAIPSVTPAEGHDRKAI